MRTAVAHFLRKTSEYTCSKVGGGLGVGAAVTAWCVSSNRAAARTLRPCHDCACILSFDYQIHSGIQFCLNVNAL